MFRRDPNSVVHLATQVADAFGVVRDLLPSPAQCNHFQ